MTSCILGSWSPSSVCFYHHLRLLLLFQSFFSPLSLNKKTVETPFAPHTCCFSFFSNIFSNFLFISRSLLFHLTRFHRHSQGILAIVFIFVFWFLSSSLVLCFLFIKASLHFLRFLFIKTSIWSRYLFLDSSLSLPLSPLLFSLYSSLPFSVPS